MRFRWSSSFVAAAVACSAAPTFIVAPNDGTDGGFAPMDSSAMQDASFDSQTPDSAPQDAGVDVIRDAMPDAAIDAGPHVDPPTPGRDALLADPDCMIAFQGPLNDGKPRPAVTELLTDARCGSGPIRFARPGTVDTWGGFDITYEPLRVGSPHLGLRSLVPLANAGNVLPLSIFLRSTTEVSTVRHPSWSLYAVMRVKALPVSFAKDQVAFVAYHPTEPSGFLALQYEASGLFLRVASVKLPMSQFGINSGDQPLLYGLRYTPSLGLRAEIRSSSAQGVRSTAIEFETTVNDAEFTLPALPAGAATLLGSGAGARNLQGELAELTLVGRALSDLENAKILDELTLVHGL
jgi:hypothetical protein